MVQNLRVKNYLEGLQELFPHFDARCLPVACSGPTTGRQLRPLSSVLYRIISKRRYILAAQLLLREKSGT